MGRRLVYVKAGIAKERAALLVIIGALSDGRKVVLACESGQRESKESWSRILRNLQRRGLKLGRLTVADGHLGIWSALAEQHPEGQEQRCWNHIVGRDPRLPEGWNVPSRVNPYEPGSLGSGAAEQSAVSKQTRHVSLRTQSGGTGKRSGRTERECMAPSWHLGRVLLGESGNGVVESPVFRRRQQRLRMHRDKKQSSPPAFRATA